MNGATLRRLSLTGQPFSKATPRFNVRVEMRKNLNFLTYNLFFN